jgi:DNA helicase-2/ATP-dependent DNA helicase PcrA
VNDQQSVTLARWAQELNPSQLEAATHGEGPLLVVAGAGSGKTKTLAYRVAYLTSGRAAPERILLLTFTRRAAKEMLKRAASVGPAGPSLTNRAWGGTFHAIGNRLLRIYAESAGLPRDFTIMDRSDAEDLLNVVRNELGLSQVAERFPRKSTCMAIYSRRVNSADDLDVVLKTHFPWCAGWQEELNALFREYAERKIRRDLLDYDDLLLYWHYLLDDDDIARQIESRFDHILVDEYQDTNRLQSSILARMRRGNNNIAVVGDDAQSIYSFRSATVRNMLDFPTQFPGTKIVRLEQNYRSTPPILRTTNSVIAQATQRHPKELWSDRKGEQRPQLVSCMDEDEQAHVVVDKVLEHYEQGIPLRRQAALFRASSHSNSLELELRRRNIPFHKYGGLRYLESSHVKDMVSFLRILENPRDEVAWMRVLQLLVGVGPATAASAFEHVAANGYDPSALSLFAAPPAARQEVRELGGLLGDLISQSGAKPAARIERVRLFYRPIMERVYEDTGPRGKDLEYLEWLARRYQSLGEFLAELALDPPVSTGDLAGVPTKDEDWLVLSTIHSAKGLEWDVVYLIHAADGCLPSDMATSSADEIEEELRLTYVAMTRARDFLYVLWPLRFYHKPATVSDNHSYSQLCRFFSDEVLRTMEVTSGAESGPARRERPGLPSRVDIAGRVRSMWT